MLSKLMGRKHLIVLSLLGMVLIGMLSLTPLLNSVHAQANNSHAQVGMNALPPVKVLIITMFPPETQAWLGQGTWKLVSKSIGSIDSDDGAVYCQISEGNCSGVYLTRTGLDKVNAATSMMAVLRDPHLSFKNAYFLTTGTAATPPYSEGTPGFVAWANWVIDRDQGTHVIPDTAPDYPLGYQPPNTSFPDNTADFHLNAALVQKAYDLTAKLKLADSSQAQVERKRYPGQANRKPVVARCDTVTSDSYLVGSQLSEQTKYIVAKLSDTSTPAHYCTMEDEDSAVASVLHRFSLQPGGPNYLQCYLNLRGATTFDQPPPGQSIEEFINEHFRVNDLVLGNIRLAASTVIDKYLLQHPCQND
jgi:purine nucleoside permease